MGNLGLSIGLRALMTSQAGLDTTGHNISNANTEGYSRQSLRTSTAQNLTLRGLIMGTGIQADVVQRTVDTLLNARITRQVSTLGRLGARFEAMTNAEDFLGANSANGVNQLLQSFFGGVSALSAAPEDRVLRTGAVQSSLALSSRFNQLANSAENLRRESVLRLEANVDEVNAIAQQISSLNHQITSSETGKLVANDLRDQRGVLVDRLAGLVDVKTVEDERGALRVLVNGLMLVSPTTVQTMVLASDQATGDVSIKISGNPQDVAVSGGAIGGQLNVLQDFLPKLNSDLDRFARNLMLEMNRVHSTGLGADGPFRLLVGAHALTDVNGSGTVTDELLSNAGLPFDIRSGELYVNMTDEQTGAMTKHKIDIDPARTLVGDLMNELNAIPNLSATIDGQGRLQVFADTGFGFDFSRRLDAAPDDLGSFGGGRASLASAAAGPFNLSVGDTIDLSGPGGPVTITFNTSGFKQIGAATAEEVAAFINADPGAQANALTASAVGGYLVLQSAGSGSTESFDVTGGTALGAFGWNPGTTVTGQDGAVSATVSGSYTGSQNGGLVFKPNMDGDIGTTPGLKIQVFDQNGLQVSTLDVGPSYTAGDELEVIDGVRVSFSLGSVSATDNDMMYLDVVANADSSDVLPALGLNVLFTGSDADTMRVRQDIVSNSSLFASSETGAVGDSTNLLRMLDLENANIDGLSNVSFSESFADIAGSLALEINTTESAQNSEEALRDSLVSRRDQVSGVNVDEELVVMMQQEQAFNAASQYIRVISETTNELMNII